MDRTDKRAVDGARPIAMYWKVQRPNGSLVTCSVFRTLSGLELRVGIDGQPPMRTKSIDSMASALTLAEQWKALGTGRATPS